MPQTPTYDQRATIQKMIDAGESEENIATVIRHFQSQPATKEPTSALDSAWDFGAGVLSQINPIEIAKGLYNTVRHPIDTATDLVKAQGAELGQVPELVRQGRYSEAAGHGLAGVLPIVGPAAAHIGEKIGQGDVARGLGEATGLIGTVVAPGMVKPGAKAVQATGLADKAAEMAQAGAERRIVDVMAPKVGAQKQRWGTMAQKVAPDVVREPGLGAFSREGLERKVSEKLSAAEEQLDQSHAARPAGVIYDTAPIKMALTDKLKALSAETAEGPDAHRQMSAMGLEFSTGAPPPGTPFKALTLPHKEELRRLVTELEELPHVERTWLDKSDDVAREGGYGTGRGARAGKSYSDKPFVEGAAGAPVYHDIIAGKSGTSRGAMVRVLRAYIDGRAPSTAIVQRAIEVADRRLRDPEFASKAQFPIDAGYAAEDVAGPIGRSVVPGPVQPRADVIQQALAEVDALGPAVSYEALRKLRQAYDKQAAVKYAPSITQDFLKVQHGAEGAADVASALRDAMSAIDPDTAKANSNYSVWRKAHDVLRATADVERTRPTVGRKIIARAAGTITGGEAGGTLGAIIGYTVGPIVDGIMSSAPTTKVVTARVLSDLSKALKAGDTAGIEAKLRTLRSLALTMKPAGQSQEAQ